jgi:hypothetical protein
VFSVFSSLHPRKSDHEETKSAKVFSFFVFFVSLRVLFIVPVGVHRDMNDSSIYVVNYAIWRSLQDK